MNTRLSKSMASPQKQLGVWSTLSSQYVLIGSLLSIIFAVNVGCASSIGQLQKSCDRSAAKISFISWNLRAKVTEPRESTESRAFKIASLSNRDLYRLMETRPAPDLATISGKWNGINKGVGSAMMGLMQDVKVLQGDQCVSGYNILVKQVSINDLPCRGWQPELDPKTCKPKTMGNFIAVAPKCCGKLGHTVKLDYTIAENPWYDPSRFLIDQLVAIDNDILLGRATAKVGAMQIPVAYFVLTRAADCNCSHSVNIDTPISYTQSQYSVLSPTPNREIVDREILVDDSNPSYEDTVAPIGDSKADDLQDPIETDSSASDKPIVYEASETSLID